MPFIPAERTARVTVNMTLNGSVVQNVFHVQASVDWSEVSLTVLANVFIDWWNTHYAPNASTALVLQSVTAKDMSVADSFGVEVAAPPGSGGDLLNPAMPGNVTLAIKHKSGYTGRNRNGRTYVAGLTEDAQSGNQITTVVRDALVNAFEALRGELVDNDWNLVVASFYNGTALVPQGDGQIIREPVPRATALLTPVLSFTANVDIDSQRRRLAGRGN